MPRRRVGPVPLVGGVHLNPAGSGANQLLDARNMEERDGLLATRRGQEFEWENLFRNAPGLVFENLSRHEPGGRYAYLGVPTEGLVSPGTMCEIDPGGLGSSDLVFEFYAADGTTRTISAQHLDGDDYRFVFPYGVLYGSPSWDGEAMPSDAHWIRVSRADGEDVSSLSVTQRLYYGTMYNFTGPFVANTRGGPVPVLALLNDPNVYSLESFAVFVRPKKGAPLLYSASPLQNVIGGYRDTFDGSKYTGDASESFFVWLSATGSLLYYSPDFWWRIDKPTLDLVDANSFDGSAQFGAEFALSDGADTAYEDIPLLSSMPRPSAVATYNRRLIVAERGTGNVRWSAPAEFWDILPEDNVYQLAGVGAGNVLGMAELYGALYIFTDSAIWRMVEVQALEGSTSTMSFSFVEGTGCTSNRSVVVEEGYIYFLAQDGVRRFNGQRSQLMTRAVLELFEADATHPLALRRSRHSEACGVFDRRRRRYLLGYPKAGSDGNDCVLVVSEDGRCWLWGDDDLAGVDTSGESGPIGQPRRGVRMQSATWHPGESRVLAVDKSGLCYWLDVGDNDFGEPILWYAETHHLGVGARGYKSLQLIEFEVAHEGTGSLRISSVPDGDFSRKDSRTVAPDTRGVDAGAVEGAFAAAGQAMAALRDAFTKARAFFRSRGTNHRAVIEAVPGSEVPVKIAAVSFEVDQ